MSTEKTGVENTENKTAEPAKDELSERELDKVSGGSKVADKAEISSSLERDVRTV